MDLAHSYANGSLDWEFCDFAANQLWGVNMQFTLEDAIDVDANQFWEFYLAFDHSETVEPSVADKVARVKIEQLLKKLPTAV